MTWTFWQMFVPVFVGLLLLFVGLEVIWSVARRMVRRYRMRREAERQIENWSWRVLRGGRQ